MIALLFVPIAQHPAWVWAVLALALGAGLWFGVKAERAAPAHAASTPQASRRRLLAWIGAGLGFGLLIAPQIGTDDSSNYFTGYLVELTFTLDNIFVAAAAVTHFKLSRDEAKRVMRFALGGIVALRILSLALGALLVHALYWVLYPFGVFLAATGFKMALDAVRGRQSARAHPENLPLVQRCQKLLGVENVPALGHFFVHGLDRAGGRWRGTPMLLALVAVAAADLVFAIDSTPTLLSITQDPLTLFAAGLFPLLGLGALYAVLAAALKRFSALRVALSLVLIFLGAKIYLGDLFFDGDFPAPLTLGVCLGVLALGGGAAALFRPKKTVSPSL